MRAPSFVQARLGVFFLKSEFGGQKSDARSGRSDAERRP